MNRQAIRISVEALLLVVVALVFVAPLLFVAFLAGKTTPEAALMSFSPPQAWEQYGPNLVSVVQAGDYQLVRAMVNSILLTLLSIVGLVLVSATAGFVLERRATKLNGVVNALILVGLMIPPSVVTTIWVLQGTHLYKTLIGLVCVEVALGFPFAALLYRAFMVTVPREIDEAAIMEGCSGWTLYSRIIFPLLKPVSATIVVLSSVNVFNDFVNPLYFLPGAQNATVQLTLYNFMSRYATQWNLMFADVLLLTIPPLVLFLFFNKQIVAGMVAGAVKS